MRRSRARPRGGGLAAAVAAGLSVYLTAIVGGPIFGGGPIILRSRHVALAPGSPGDDDGFADADETIDLTVSLRNMSGLNLEDVVVGLDSTDPRIECVGVPIV